ncbi:hypothetical protein HDU96_002959 [Phlyctochytrium bullatum]|nr:hypothetical protein HDU96_002959 [Phlyctochytrium bullatum]
MQSHPDHLPPVPARSPHYPYDGSPLTRPAIVSQPHPARLYDHYPISPEFQPPQPGSLWGHPHTLGRFFPSPTQPPPAMVANIASPAPWPHDPAILLPYASTPATPSRPPPSTVVPPSPHHFAPAWTPSLDGTVDMAAASWADHRASVVTSHYVEPPAPPTVLTHGLASRMQTSSPPTGGPGSPFATGGWAPVPLQAFMSEDTVFSVGSERAETDGGTVKGGDAGKRMQGDEEGFRRHSTNSHKRTIWQRLFP